MVLEFLPFEPWVSYQYQATAMLGGLVFLNSLACHAFRTLRHDANENPTLSVFLSTLEFGSRPHE